MIKEFRRQLQSMIDISRIIFQNNKTRDNLINYLYIRKLVCCNLELTKMLEKQSGILEELSTALNDYKYILSFFKNYMKKDDYSKMLYAAYAALKATRKQEDTDVLFGK